MSINELDSRPRNQSRQRSGKPIKVTDTSSSATSSILISIAIADEHTVMIDGYLKVPSGDVSKLGIGCGRPSLLVGE